jgi:hypothetical protein
MYTLQDKFEIRKKEISEKEKIKKEYALLGISYSHQILIPEIGMGITVTIGSDRYPATIVQIKKSKNDIVSSFFFQRDKIVGCRDDQNSYYEKEGYLTYLYTPNPNAPLEIAKLTISGSYKTDEGFYVYVGERQHRQDPSF